MPKRSLLLVLAVLALLVPGTAALAAAAKPRATSGVAYASATHTEGQDLYVSGDIKDKVLGRGAIVYVTNVRQGEAEGEIEVTARRITIYFPNGTLTGTGKATQVIQGDQVTVRDGTFDLTKGTGKLKGRKLKGTFAGDQRNGVYKFDYTGTLR